MEVKKHINKATIEIDFQSLDSVKRALDFITINGGIHEGIGNGTINRIALIKMVRAYGENVLERERSGDPRPTGLARAKDFVDKHGGKLWRRDD